MKSKSLLLLICVFTLISRIHSQTKEERVKEIKAMYADVMKLEKSEGFKNCNKKTEFETEQNTEFQQKAMKCNYSNNYSIAVGEFSGWEWDAKTIFYYKNKKLFFVFVKQNAEACATEFRVYYDNSETPIKYLEKTNDCSGDDPSKQTEVKDQSRKNEISKLLKDDLAKINRILKN